MTQNKTTLKTNNLILLLFVNLLLSIFTNQARSQNFGDKSFYLIDSIDLDDLTLQDKLLIDTSLTNYHKTIQDTAKFEIIQFIVDECWNDNVWPRYNSYLTLELHRKLRTNCKQRERLKTLYYTAGTLANIGFLYDKKNDLSNALNYYHQSLGLYEFVSDKEGAAIILNNLGVIYSLVDDTTRSLQYHRESLELKKQIGDITGAAMSYNNIGSVYEGSNQPFIALEYYEYSLDIRKELKNDRGSATTYCNIGDIYFSHDMYSKAYEFYDKGLTACRIVGDPEGTAIALDNMSNVLLKLNRFNEAKVYALEGFKVAKRAGHDDEIKNSAFTLSKIYEIEGNFKEALIHSNIYIKLNKAVDITQDSKLAMQKGLEYDFKKKELQDSLQFEKEREVHNLKIEEKETQAYVLYGGLFLLVIILLIAIKSFVQKKRDNHRINVQKTKVEIQKKEIENQHLVLASTHKEISDSIAYAKRIQQAILPTSEMLNHHLKDGFVFFKPKDVVSGDFYWLEKVGDKIIFAVADCTGHGVPGALVSVVCHNALNRAVREFKIVQPSKILDKTRELIIETFSSSEKNVRDGMDISICCWDQSDNSLQWAGANNPLYIIRKDKVEISITPSDKQPVGRFETFQDFTNHHLQLFSGDLIYLFSDGFQDQFGGQNGKKYKRSRFKQFLLHIKDQDLEKQRTLLEREFNEWKGNLEQLDDVCIIGVKVN